MCSDVFIRSFLVDDFTFFFDPFGGKEKKC